MNIDLNLIHPHVTQHLSYDLDFSHEKLNTSLIRKINSCHVEADVSLVNDLVYVNIFLHAKVTLICAYTLEDVITPINEKEQFIFTNNKEIENENYIYEDKSSIHLDPYIFSFLIASLPTKVIKKGATLPKDGDGYRILSEEEYEKEQNSKKDPRWSKLDEITFDE